VVTDGSAHLAMKNGSNNTRNVIYGPGSKLDNLMASKMACGEPIAVIERLGEGPTDFSKSPKQTVTLTMASQADTVLLIGMAHCAEYASALHGIELGAAGSGEVPRQTCPSAGTQTSSTITVATARTA